MRWSTNIQSVFGPSVWYVSSGTPGWDTGFGVVAFGAGDAGADDDAGAADGSAMVPV